jgi:DNA-binding NarL/FixJ family response regulator
VIDQPIRVLLIEDDPNHAKALQAMLGRVNEFDYQMVHCYKLYDGLRQLEISNFDVILLDLGLPDSEGFNTFKTVYDNAPDIPIVIFTALFSEDIALKTLKEGAQEYLFKGEFDGQDLSTAIMHSQARNEYVSSVKQSIIIY